MTIELTKLVESDFDQVGAGTVTELGQEEINCVVGGGLGGLATSIYSSSSSSSSSSDIAFNPGYFATGSGTLLLESGNSVPDPNWTGYSSSSLGNLS